MEGGNRQKFFFRRCNIVIRYELKHYNWTEPASSVGCASAGIQTVAGSILGSGIFFRGDWS